MNAVQNRHLEAMGMFNRLSGLKAFRWLYGGNWHLVDGRWGIQGIQPVCEMFPMEIGEVEVWGDRLNTVVEKLKIH